MNLELQYNYVSKVANVARLFCHYQINNIFNFYRGKFSSPLLSKLSSNNLFKAYEVIPRLTARDLLLNRRLRLCYKVVRKSRNNLVKPSMSDFSRLKRLKRSYKYLLKKSISRNVKKLNLFILRMYNKKTIASVSIKSLQRVLRALPSINNFNKYYLKRMISLKNRKLTMQRTSFYASTLLVKPSTLHRNEYLLKYHRVLHKKKLATYCGRIRNVHRGFIKTL